MQNETKRLMGKYYRQRLSASELGQLKDYCAVTFRPGGHADSFEGKGVRRTGQAVMLTLGYDAGSDGPTIPVHAYGSTTGSVGDVRRGERDLRLCLDLRRRPQVGARGRVIDPARNPSLLETALRMDQRCQVLLRSGRAPADCLRMPRVLLGFAAQRPPAFEDTVALRHRAARKLGISFHRLGQNGDVLLDKLLRDVWDESLVSPHAPENLTGNLLVDRELCPSARGFLNVFEDFSELLGVPTWNPAREVVAPMFANPAYKIWEAAGYTSPPDFNQPLPDAVLVDIEARMHSELPEHAAAFSREDIYDGLTNPDEPLRMWSQLLPQLRQRLPHWANACSTDSDLRDAVRHPEQPLWVRYACRVQVVSRRAAIQALSDAPEAPSLENSLAAGKLTANTLALAS